MSNTEKKITKREMFTRLLSLEQVQADSELVSGIEHELELLDKKNERKPSEKQIQKLDHDADLRVAIMAEMAPGEAYTADDLVKTCPTLVAESGITAPKVSYLMRELLATNKVTKETIKRKTYWKLA